MIQKEKDKRKKRNSMKPIITAPQDEPLSRLRRTASYGGPDERQEHELRRRELRRLRTNHDQDDIYMRGALGPDDSNDEYEDHVRIVRR